MSQNPLRYDFASVTVFSGPVPLETWQVPNADLDRVTQALKHESGKGQLFDRIKVTVTTRLMNAKIADQNVNVDRELHYVLIWVSDELWTTLDAALLADKVGITTVGMNDPMVKLNLGKLQEREKQMRLAADKKRQEEAARAGQPAAPMDPGANEDGTHRNDYPA